MSTFFILGIGENPNPNKTQVCSHSGGMSFLVLSQPGVQVWSLWARPWACFCPSELLCLLGSLSSFLLLTPHLFLRSLFSRFYNVLPWHSLPSLPFLFGMSHNGLFCPNNVLLKHSRCYSRWAIDQ